MKNKADIYFNNLDRKIEEYDSLTSEEAILYKMLHALMVYFSLFRLGDEIENRNNLYHRLMVLADELIPDKLEDDDEM